MATRKTSRTSSSKQRSRPAPVRKVPVQAAPHSKTMANGQPRPKRRG